MGGARPGPFERANKFRELLELWFRAEGLTDVRRVRTATMLCAAVAEELPPSDFTGVPAVIRSRIDQKRDLSGSLDQAKKDAARAGTDFYFSIQRRGGRDVGDQYVLTSLSVLAKLLPLIEQAEKKP